MLRLIGVVVSRPGVHTSKQRHFIIVSHFVDKIFSVSSFKSEFISSDRRDCYIFVYCILSLLRERPKFIGTWGWCFRYGVVTFFHIQVLRGYEFFFLADQGVYTFFHTSMLRGLHFIFGHTTLRGEYFFSRTKTKFSWIFLENGRNRKIVTQKLYTKNKYFDYRC